LLHLEVEITELEKKMLELDKAQSADPAEAPRLKSTTNKDVKEAWGAQRKLLESLRIELNNYGRSL
jgi:hypothetical protein